MLLQMKKHNYSAGPCILPQEVFEKSAQAILNFNNSDLSLLEISHRSKDFVAVMDEARALALELLGSQILWILSAKIVYIQRNLKVNSSNLNPTCLGLQQS